MLVPVKSFSPKLVPGEVLNISEDTVSCKQLKDEIVAITGIPSEQFKLYQSKRYLHDEHIIQHGQTVHMLLELRGGKGGFGSMLRAIGAQIEKTTNKEACRDLSGRRLRDINEEKRLKKWIAKQAERERERAERKQRRLERLRALPPHEFHDPAYDKICLNLSENVSDAVSKGLENMKKNEGPLKRKATSTITKAPKKLQLWNDEEFNTSDTDDPSSSENSKDSTEDDVSQNFQVGECSGSDNSTSSTKTLLCAESHSSENEILIQQDESLSTKKSSEKEDLVHNMNAYNTVEELEALGLARLKIVLSSLNMKCGGTLRERATRLFAVKETKNEEIDQILKSMK